VVTALEVAPRRARSGVPRAAATGLALGVAWGVAARIWMRLISTDPEFTWSGTGFILGATGIGGLALGLMYGVRRAGRSRWWRLLVVVCVPVFAGPGVPFLPVLLIGGLAFSGRRRLARWAGAVAIVAAAILLWLLFGADGHVWVLTGGFLLLSLALAAGAAELYRPRVST